MVIPGISFACFAASSFPVIPMCAEILHNVICFHKTLKILSRRIVIRILHQISLKIFIIELVIGFFLLNTKVYCDYNNPWDA